MNLSAGNVIYTPTARFDGTARALTEDELHRVAPSVFATSPHESRSERFQPIPTYEIVKALAAEGFHVVGARQSMTRVEGKAPFTKHMLRLRRLDDSTANLRVGDNVFEMLLKNANDGTSAYDLLAAMWRIRCSNSLVAQGPTVDTVKVRHSGSVEAVRGKVIEGTYRVLQEAERVLAAPADWSSVILSRSEQEILARSAHMLRFGPAAIDEETGETIAPSIEPKALLVPRRFTDNGRDLWTTFNIVQENAIKGGLQGKSVNPDTGQTRRVTTRQIKGIDQDTNLNRALWALGEEMKRLKTAA